jgi:two-component system, cell cycle sensor histidine kinase and response regulator CckA
VCSPLFSPDSTRSRSFAETYLPAALSGAAAREVGRSYTPEPAEMAHTIPLILLAEDEPSLRALVSRVLRSRGYHVVEAANGADAEALAAAHDQPFHLLLTDVMMPGMGGVELAARLRAAGKAARVIFMTGYTDTDLPRDSATLLLRKPFLPASLAEAVCGMLADV